jgi:hypothetical protein
VDIKVLGTQPAERVRWEVLDGPDEGIGDEFSIRCRSNLVPPWSKAAAAT